MKAIVCHELSGPAALRLEDVPEPRPGPGQVRVRVRACGINFADSLIVRGQSHLLQDVGALEDLSRIRQLFDDLEQQRDLIGLLGLAEKGDGVSIFIGSESKLFSLSGSSTIIAPYTDAAGRIVGVLGVIGPTRLNYARVIPTVDYAARIVSRMLGG